jgi:hypothetical protein
MLALDVLLLIFTGACVLYCSVLNRRITDLQDHKNNMMKMLDNFGQMIAKAEYALENTQKLSTSTKNDLEYVISVGHNTANHITSIIAKADQLADDLATIVSSGNRLMSQMHTLHSTEQRSDRHIVQDAFVESGFNTTVRENEVQASAITQTSATQTSAIKLTQKDYYSLIQKKQRFENAF